jgi:hypothetical protein
MMRTWRDEHERRDEIEMRYDTMGEQEIRDRRGMGADANEMGADGRCGNAERI